MFVPLHRFIIVQEESAMMSRSGMVIHKINEDQLLRTKVMIDLSAVHDEFPMLEQGTIVYIRPFHFYRMRVNGTIQYIVDIQDVILVDLNNVQDPEIS